MPLGIQQRGTYNTLNDYLKFTNNEKTSVGSILREIETVQSFSKLLPIKVCTTDKDGDKFVDVGTFEEPYVRNKSSVKTSLDGFGIDATYQTYQRFDYMAYRKSESKIYKYELRMAPREVNLWRISKLGKKARDMAIDMEFDMLYDDAAKNKYDCSGIYPRYSVLTDRNGIIKSGTNQGKLSRYTTIDAGGTGSDLTSIIFMVPDAEMGVCRLFPEGGTDFQGPIEIHMGRTNLSEEWNRESGTDARGVTGTREYTIDEIDTVYGIGILSRGALVRIANIDLNTLTEDSILKMRHAFREAYYAISPTLRYKPILALMNADTRIFLADSADKITLPNQITNLGFNDVPLHDEQTVKGTIPVVCDAITTAEEQVA